MASDKTVGVLGGGQLGRMLAEAANLLEIKVNFLDAVGSSAKQVSGHNGHVEGSFKDRTAIQKLADQSDIITVEIEHVDTKMLEEISEKVDVQPSWKTLRMIQDKYLQKQHLEKHGIASMQSLALSEPTVPELERVSGELGLPLMLKSRRDAYDGRGNFAVKTTADFTAALEALAVNRDLYAEAWCNFRMELAVMVVKTETGVLSFPTVETIHENSICKLTYAPARGVSAEVNQQAQHLAKQAVACFWGKGVFGVEMFLTTSGKLLINEIAPRPHNSGHYTIEACPVSQYEAHLRAILDLPLHQEDLELREPSIMLNILGGDAPDSHLTIARAALQQRRTKIHLYGKGAFCYPPFLFSFLFLHLLTFPPLLLIPFLSPPRSSTQRPQDGPSHSLCTYHERSRTARPAHDRPRRPRKASSSATVPQSRRGGGEKEEGEGGASSSNRHGIRLRSPRAPSRTRNAHEIRHPIHSPHHIRAPHTFMDGTICIFGLLEQYQSHHRRCRRCSSPSRYDGRIHSSPRDWRPCQTEYRRWYGLSPQYLQYASWSPCGYCVY